MASQVTAPDTSPPPLSPDAENTFDLRILATTDLHMHLLPWDYEQDCRRDGRSLSCLSALIAAARDEVANTVLLDNGDFLQGTALGDRAALDHAAGKIVQHPMIAAMTDLGYDAINLGNHDFSHGLPFLLDMIEQAACPVISTNALTSTPRNLFLLGPGAQTLVAPWAVIDRQLQGRDGQRHSMKIGVLGFVPPQTVLWESHILARQIVVEDILTAARRAIPQLRAEGADIIVALSHSGVGAQTAHDGMENAAVPLAAVPGIDVLIAGHTHLVFPSPRFDQHPGVDTAQGTVSGIPAVMPGAYGSHLGVIDLKLDRQPDGRWRVLGHHAECRAVDRTARHDPAPNPAIDSAHQATRDWAAQPIARLDRPMSTHFALISPAPALRLIAQAQARHVEAALRRGAYAHLPVLSAIAPFRAGGRAGPDNYAFMPAGELRLRHVMTLYPHPNVLTALCLTGAELVDWLERAAGIFNRIIPGKPDQPLLNPDFPPFNFDMIDGLDFQIDLSQPSRFDGAGEMADANAHRIRDLTLKGRPIKPDARFILATNSYRSGGGTGFRGANPANVVLHDAKVQDVLTQYLKDRGTALPPAPTGWRFAAMPETSVTFDTAPAAALHPTLWPDLPLEPLEETASGFLRFRLRL